MEAEVLCSQWFCMFSPNARWRMSRKFGRWRCDLFFHDFVNFVLHCNMLSPTVSLLNFLLAINTPIFLVYDASLIKMSVIRKK